MNIKKHIRYWAGDNFEAEYTQYLAKLSTLGYTQPSDSVKVAENKALKDFKYLFSGYTIDTLNIYGFGSIEAGAVNIIDADTFQHTLVNSPDFLEGSGVKSNGTTSYINTQYKTDQYSGIENTLSTIVYISESSTAFSTLKTVVGARILSAVNTNIRIDPLATATTGSRQRYAAADTFANTDMKGLYISTNDGGGNNVIYKDYDGLGGGIKDSAAQTPTAPDISNNVYLLARNGNTSGGDSPGNYFPHYTVLLMRVRKNLTDADAISIKSIWDTFRAGVGLLVVMGSTSALWGSTEITFNQL